MSEAEVAPSSQGSRSSLVPGPGSVFLFTVVMLCPLLVAAGYPLVPGVFRKYLLSLPLPVVIAETALVFMVLVQPMMLSLPGTRASRAAGACRGVLLGCLALPFILCAGEVYAAGAGDVVRLLIVLVVTGAGAAGAGLAWGARGAVAAIAACCLPGLLGYVAQDLYPAMHWSMRMSPFVEVATGSGWRPSVLALLPGLVLAVCAAIASSGRSRGADCCAQ